MNQPLPIDLPELSDEAASEILDFLYQLTQAFETRYAAQLLRYQHTGEPLGPDQFDDFEDDELSF